ncbi:DUF3696 domain-containing protein [Corallococcus exercitus]|uniref:DUF3696 domain-containing protein n=1 Tax=Corallococcus exercitus TaxID=2316736 RepID=A0A3A8IAE6_9BACT|nr:DUF3696 domain-containing protein [Corallococcus exercitus]NOK35336.1 DUF3696 domain-containing protein [Corallococcus exercitus]RKG80449.1 DUF3696 domain-containing protein [Corallococcus exercitus]
MLKKLHLQNFKAWKDTGDIQLAPLTMFFGTNSSGKTSLQQFLLLLQQTAQSRDRKRVLNLGDENTPVDMGTFPEILFRQDPAAILRFNMEWGVRTQEKGAVDTVSFEALIGHEDTQSTRIEVKQLIYRLRTLQSTQGIGMTRRTHGPGYELFLENVELARQGTAREALSAPIHFYGFPHEAEAHYKFLGDLDSLALELEDQLDAIQYLGPLRQPPHRTYLWSGEAPESVGDDGSLAVAALLAANERSIQVEDHPARPFAQLIAERLVSMGLLDSFEVRPIAPHRKEYEVFVRTPGSPMAVRLPDVGFGVSQVMPVLLQCFYTEPGSTLLFEQPELHLHPKAQTELADVFIDAIHASEDGQPRNIQLLIESHSEHVLRRIQRRIAEGKLLPEETALYFCSPGPDGSRIEKLKLDEYGNITNWPKDFFGDDMGDLVAMTEAAMKRQQEGDP